MKKLVRAIFVSIVWNRFVQMIWNRTGAIDNNSPKYKRFFVSVLNKARGEGDGFMLWEFKRLSIRDPHSYPMFSHFSYSKNHPFVYRKNI